MIVKEFIPLLVLILFSSNANAHLTAELNNQTFQPYDTVIITATVTNNGTEEVYWALECSIYSPGSYPPYLYSESLYLYPKETQQVNFSLSIVETAESGNYTAYLELLEYTSALSNSTLNFTVTGTLKEINASLRTCKDFNCSSLTSVFLINETAYIKLITDLEVNISARLETPSSNESLNFSNLTATVLLIETGGYNAEVNLSREGYKSSTEGIIFAVIREEPSIQEESSCNEDGTCDSGENHQNCPQDCPSGGEDGICDLVEDGICDPDCNGTRDEDCRIDYNISLYEGWNLISFPLEKIEGAGPSSPLGVGTITEDVQSTITENIHKNTRIQSGVENLASFISLVSAQPIPPGERISTASPGNPSATLSVETTGCAIEPVYITVNAQDEEGVWAIHYWLGIKSGLNWIGEWAEHICDGMPPSCAYTWTASISEPGTHYIFGYVYDSDSTGVWSDPQSIEVEIRDCGITSTTTSISTTSISTTSTTSISTTSTSTTLSSTTSTSTTSTSTTSTSTTSTSTTTVPPASNNKKNSEKFTERTAFIAPLKDFRTVLQSVSLSTWTTTPDSDDWEWCKKLIDESTGNPREFNGNKRGCGYPVLVYYEEEGSTEELNLDWDEIWDNSVKRTIKFYIDKDMTVEDISLYMYQSEPHSGDIIVDIYDPSEGEVTASVREPSFDHSNPPEWFMFTFPEPVELKKGYYQLQVYMDYEVTIPWIYWGFRYIDNPDTELHRRLFKIGSERVWDFDSLTYGNIDVDSTILSVQRHAPDEVKIYAEKFELDCGNGVDEDYDGLIDKEDADCELLDLLTANNDKPQMEIQLNPNNFVGAGLQDHQITKICPNSYFSYWDYIEEVVVVDYDNYKEGLMGAVLASYRGAPLIFVDNENLEKYKNILNGRIVYIVGDVGSDVFDYIWETSEVFYSYTLETWQEEYVKFTGTDKVILVNPNDRGIYLNWNYQTERSWHTIKKLFANQSIAAPFLAAAKQEVIIFADVTGSPENPTCEEVPAITQNIETIDSIVESEVQRLFSENLPKYLTIVASPKAIPDSVYRGCDRMWQFRTAVDWKYGVIGDVISKSLQYPEIVVDMDGEIHIVWVDKEDLHSDIYYAKSDGTNWDIEKVTEEDNWYSEYPDIAADKDGFIHIVWQDEKGGNMEIYYAKKEVSWSEERVTDLDGSNSEKPRIAIDSDDGIHIVWSDSSDGNIHYAKKEGSDWNMESVSDSGFTGNPSIAVYNNDEIHLAWEDFSKGESQKYNPEVFYAKKVEESWAIERLTEDDDKYSNQPDIALDQDEIVHIVWQDERDEVSRTYYKNKGPGGWSDEVILSDGESTNPVIATDTNNRVHVVWTEYKYCHRDMYYRQWDGEWSNYESVLNGYFTKPMYPAIAADQDNSYVVWKERAEGDIYNSVI